MPGGTRVVPSTALHAPAHGAQGVTALHPAATFLGTTIAANTPGAAALKTGARHLFNHHPNVGPFIGKQLIQRLVASNRPSAYVGRVAAQRSTTTARACGAT